MLRFISLNTQVDRHKINRPCWRRMIYSFIKHISVINVGVCGAGQVHCGPWVVSPYEDEGTSALRFVVIYKYIFTI